MSPPPDAERRAVLARWAGCAAYAVLAASAAAGPAALPLTAVAAVPALERLPPAVIARAGELQRLGQGTMRWFGLHVYDAALWVRGSTWQPDDLFALDVVYGRSLTGKAVAESSISEMRRVGFTDEAQHARWLAEMIRVFPDIVRGDRLVGVSLKGAGVVFYNQHRLLGTIDDPVFARAFFAIWLDPKTREPQLRARLLGQP